MNVPPLEQMGEGPRWSALRSSHLRLRSYLMVARVCIEALRVMTRLAPAGATERRELMSLGERYDEVRRLLLAADRELDAIEQARGWSRTTSLESRSGEDRRSGRERRFLHSRGLRLERRHAERRTAERRVAECHP